MSAPNICFLGTGKINVKHLRVVRKLRPNARLSVASRDLERARAFQQKHNLHHAFGDYREAIASDEVEAVLIGTPPKAHAELVEFCLEAKKSALIEKPVFNSFDDFARLYGPMCDHPGVMMVAENLHYAPFHRRIKTLLADDALGQPLYLDLTRLGRSSPGGWRIDPEEMPLGALHEGGVHWIRRILDLAAVFDESLRESIIDVSCFGPPAPVTKTPHEDTSLIVTRHRSGLTSRLLHTWGVPWRFLSADSSKFVCEHGAIYFDGRGISGKYYGPHKRRRLWPNVRDAGGSVAMWSDFLQALEGGKPPELSLEMVFIDFAYMDAAYRSRQSGKPETLRLDALR
ncbi:MAG: Gfo/Idh/MocA family oxidoreductase [Deltaproteobacteria bacterium]|nr:Gfo/Idh/MocA family oxidoreductase [Deltaproteobacteria bacterium]